jgi:hypothetical protein
MSSRLTLFTKKSITNATLKTVSLIGTVITLFPYALPSFAQTSSGTISPEAISQIQALEQEKASRTVQMRKIDSQIIYALKAKRGDSLFTKVPALRNAALTDHKGRVKVVIHTVSPLSNSLSLLDKIKAIAGVEIINAPTNLNRIIALIPLDFVETLATVPDIKMVQGFVRPGVSGTGLGPGRNAGSVNTQADIAHAAANVRAAYGINGSGVKIGVLSDSYNNLGGASNDIASGNLPASGVTLVGSGDLASGGTDEGRAMLQLIHDLAPGSQLYFATGFNSEADMANNIRALKNAGCKIIVDDVYWTSAAAFQDGVIAQAVNEVTSKGVLYFSSAGNSGNYNDGTSGVWEGNFSETGAAFGRGTAHNFGGSIANALTAPSGYITLQWSDTFYNSTNDYDLYVLDSTGSQVVAASTNVQAGNAFPFEYTGPQAAGNQVVVVRASGQARYLRLDTQRGRLGYNTVGQIWGHPAATGAIAVAATSAAGRNSAFTGGAANPVETFSSDGPRRVFFNADGSAITPGNFLSDGGTVRQKPDITAADGVATSFPAYPASYFNPFYGTSAAAPHAAAIAALVKSYKPNLTASQIRNILTSTALDIEAGGYDRDSGYGIVMADRALQKAQQMR